MNILLYDITSYTQKDLIYYLTQQGFHCKNVIYKPTDHYQDDFFERKFEHELSNGSFDFVMSTNFSPIVAKICNRHNKKYIAWVYDSPINTDHIEYYQYDTSYIFLFDRIEAERIIALGGINIYHLPLATNAKRFQSIKISAQDRDTYSADISFIGKFYDSPLKQLMSCQSDYDKGYISAILDTQINVYGYNFIEEMISDELLFRINSCLQTAFPGSSAVTKRGFIQSIATQVTNTERLALANLLGEYHNMTYYSTEQPESLKHLKYGGTAKYFTEMPKIFQLSKLNLNPTLKSIQSGIPLRALDILGSGGVLFSNYQLELAEYFTDGVDVIMYESIEDALCKADYYLTHEEERIQIARNGYQKALTDFSYPPKIEFMLETAGVL